MIRAIYPGTFDPVHFGHIDVARRAAAIFDELIVAVFSLPQKNLLFATEERVSLVAQAIAGISNARVDSYDVLTVDYARRQNAQVIVRGLRVFSDFDLEFRMALTNKRLAPEIETVNLMTREEHAFLTSTTVKEVAALNGDITSMVPTHVRVALLARFLKLGGGVGNSMQGL
jgi:pantetheine-phosphate adenylyltransferase